MARVTIVNKGLLTKVRINEVEIPGVIDYHFATTVTKKPAFVKDTLGWRCLR